MLQTEIIADLDSLNEENVLLTYQLPLSKRPIMAENKVRPLFTDLTFTRISIYSWSLRM